MATSTRTTTSPVEEHQVQPAQGVEKVKAPGATAAVVASRQSEPADVPGEPEAVTLVHPGTGDEITTTHVPEVNRLKAAGYRVRTERDGEASATDHNA